MIRNLFLGLMLVLVAGPASAGILAVTIENIGRPYEVIEGKCIYQEAAGFSFKDDPIDSAVKNAFVKMEKIALTLGADAFVGFDIDFANRSQKDEGRVVLCGTFVKFK
jgi:hypothetical protein